MRFPDAGLVTASWLPSGQVYFYKKEPAGHSGAKKKKAIGGRLWWCNGGLLARIANLNERVRVTLGAPFI